ncbi:hypothetical protein Goshw_018693 [Gossypium schwendimanii]|uniref:Uncharacterized protein n=2 Tax=Gossypium TaxID=3633 RepID=A0A7J9M5F5_GOSSC|nr:hypothetical protein [Gossypium davidsonii]MBA0866188.1 hypothetical protein [Gossypium schwendimanii]
MISILMLVTLLIVTLIRS